MPHPANIYGLFPFNVVLVVAVVAGTWATNDCFAFQNPAAGATQAGKQADTPTERPEIERRQQRLLEDYRLLEEKLFTLYQYEKDKNPVRAKLLEKAYQRSQQTATIAKLELASGYLSEAKLKQAETEQAKSLTDLNGLLALLQSEDRDKRIRDELERYQEYLKEVERLLRIQKGLRGQAEGAGDPQKIAQSEAQAADRAKKLADEIKENEEAPDSEDDREGEGADGKGAESGESDGDSGGDSADGEASGESEEGKSEPGKKEEGQGGKESDQEGGEKSEGDSQSDLQGDGAKEGDSQESKGSDQSSQGQQTPSGDSQQSEGQPSEGQAGQPGQPGDGEGEQQPENTENPIRKRISNSEDHMRNAQQQLQQAKRDEAVEEMKQAEKEIAEAKKQLEEILRQLREEEVERTLAMLEGRFRRMLQQEIEVKDSTEKLNQTADDQRTTDFDIQTGKLATSQNSIATDASRALLLLREDGSSVAFPVTVEEMHLDMLQIAARLSAAKVGEFTIELQSDVIDTLNYLVDALAQAQKENEQKKSAQQPPGGGPPPSPGEDALVGKIAELKMLRGLQERIHLQHQRYAKALGDVEQPVVTADTPDLIAGLKRLAAKQRKLTRIAQDIVKESNK